MSNFHKTCNYVTRRSPLCTPEPALSEAEGSPVVKISWWRISQLGVCLRFLLAPPHPQISLHQRPQIAIQHAIHVADLQLRAVILNHAVRLQHIRPDLRTEIDIQFRILDLFR